MVVPFGLGAARHGRHGRIVVADLIPRLGPNRPKKRRSNSMLDPGEPLAVGRRALEVDLRGAVRAPTETDLAQHLAAAPSVSGASGIWADPAASAPARRRPASAAAARGPRPPSGRSRSRPAPHTRCTVVRRPELGEQRALGGGRGRIEGDHPREAAGERRRASRPRRSRRGRSSRRRTGPGRAGRSASARAPGARRRPAPARARRPRPAGRWLRSGRRGRGRHPRGPRALATAGTAAGSWRRRLGARAGARHRAAPSAAYRAVPLVALDPVGDVDAVRAPRSSSRRPPIPNPTARQRYPPSSTVQRR